MLPSPRIFRSRWAALFWAGGILWMAADVARSASQEDGPQTGISTADVGANTLDIADLDALSNALD